MSKKPEDKEKARQSSELDALLAKANLPRCTQEPLPGKSQLYYEHTFHCTNCRHDNVLYILKGNRINSVEATCDKCGCSVHVAG